MELVPSQTPLDVWRREHPDEDFFGEHYDDPYEQWMDPEEPVENLGIPPPPQVLTIPLILAQMFHMEPCDLDYEDDGYYDAYDAAYCDLEADMEEDREGYYVAAYHGPETGMEGSEREDEAEDSGSDIDPQGVVHFSLDGDYESEDDNDSDYLPDAGDGFQ